MQGPEVTLRANALRRANVLMSAMTLVLTGCGQESDVSPGSGAAVGNLILDPSATIGETEGDPAYLFGDIRALAADDAGRIYVGDRIGATIRVYSPEGAFIEEIAREGQGPGEIEGWPADLTFGPDGRLFVRDAARVTVFARRGQDGIADSLASSWNVPEYGDLTGARSRVADDGAYYYPGGAFRTGERPRFIYEVFREGRVTGDTLEVPYHEGMEAHRPAFVRLGARGGRMVNGLSHVPFAPVPTWDITAQGTVISTDGQSDRLLETDLTGDTLRVFTLPGSGPRPVPARERGDSMVALEARIDSLPVRIEEVVNLGEGVAERQLPVLLPTAMSVHVAESGLLWVERWPEQGAGASRFYDILDPTGAHRASVTLRTPFVSDPQPYFGRSIVVGVVEDPETGVQHVVVFALADLLDE